MKKESQKYEKGKRYLKKFEIIETGVELSIQGQVHDPEDLYEFLKDLENENVSKVIGIYLDDKNLFLGHQVFLGSSPKNFDTQRPLCLFGCYQLSDTPDGRHPTFVIDLTLPGAHGFRVE